MRDHETERVSSLKDFLAGNDEITMMEALSGESYRIIFRQKGIKRMANKVFTISMQDGERLKQIMGVCDVSLANILSVCGTCNPTDKENGHIITFENLEENFPLDQGSGKITRALCHGISDLTEEFKELINSITWERYSSLISIDKIRQSTQFQRKAICNTIIKQRNITALRAKKIIKNAIWYTI